MFDFTSMHAAENASRIVERKGRRLLMCIVGDTLIEVSLYFYLLIVDRRKKIADSIQHNQYREHR